MSVDRPRFGIDPSPLSDIFLSPRTESSIYEPRSGDEFFISPFSNQSFDSGYLKLGLINDGKEVQGEFFIPIKEKKIRILRGALWKLQSLYSEGHTADFKEGLQLSEQIRNVVMESIFETRDAFFQSLPPFN